MPAYSSDICYRGEASAEMKHSDHASRQVMRKYVSKHQGVICTNEDPWEFSAWSESS